MTKDKFLTRGWNNILAALLGIPLFVYIVFVLSTSTLSAFQSFIGLAIGGAVY